MRQMVDYLYKMIILQNIVNMDDHWLSNMSKRLSTAISFGIENEADVKGIIHESMPLARFSIDYKGIIDELGSDRCVGYDVAIDI